MATFEPQFDSIGLQSSLWHRSRAYAMGFRKTAEAHGIDPVALVKYAYQQAYTAGAQARTPEQRNAFLYRTIHEIANSMSDEPPPWWRVGNKSPRTLYLDKMRKQYPEAMYGDPSKGLHYTPSLPRSGEFWNTAATSADVARSYTSSERKINPASIPRPITPAKSTANPTR